MVQLTIMTTGQKITVARDRLGWKQKDLALAAGVHQTQVGKWEKDEVKIFASQLFAVAKALGVSCDYLLDPELNEPPLVPVGEKQRLVWKIAEDLGWDVAYEAFLSAARVTIGTPLPTVHRGEPKSQVPVSQDAPPEA